MLKGTTEFLPLWQPVCLSVPDCFRCQVPRGSTTQGRKVKPDLFRAHYLPQSCMCGRRKGRCVQLWMEGKVELTPCTMYVMTDMCYKPMDRCGESRAGVEAETSFGITLSE
ncbi:hypothetical protein Pcinc_003439 [Petrolisthes cinctipes]|uniref:Uncharacterized protein n=1 Tax=Petrolisthes cinctipes TaxID=88211 RepID=A0AAE1L1C1_PETCI|nr:hypothetical protein Pcinc_003439 [Petrolisthes cinctipes]